LILLTATDTVYYSNTGYTKKNQVILGELSQKICNVGYTKEISMSILIVPGNSVKITIFRNRKAKLI